MPGVMDGRWILFFETGMKESPESGNFGRTDSSLLRGTGSDQQLRKEEAMNEQELRGLIEAVREGKLTRRDFVGTLLAFGVAAPIAGQLLMHAGIAQAQPASGYKATKRGGGGALKVLWWQGATLLNPHFAVGTKDQDGSRIFYEPLAGWDDDGNLIPVLAAEIPTPENGGVSKDGKVITWKLKKDVQWHDGKPFTSADVVFNWEYASDPATAAVTIGSYKDVKVQAIDAYTVRVEYAKASPFWADPFVGIRGMIIPKHLFEAYKGAKSRDAPNNLKPVGTGPYKFVDFTPGDMVRGALNPNYHQPNRPFFDTIEMKGGGDAVSAARAVLQTGEFDYAWNLQVEDEILTRLEAGGKGRVNIIPGGDIELIQFNFTDPWTEVDGERASIKTKHPLLTDPAVREAINLLVDRASVQQFIYGRTGIATANFVNNPQRFRSKSNKFEFNVDKANQLLENSGLEEGCRRHPGQGRQEAQVRLPDLGQPAAPEDAGHREAGGPESGDRPRTQDRHRVGVLLVGCRQPRYLHQVLLRHADVHDDDDAARPRDLHEPVRFMGVLHQSEQVAGPQHHALAQRRVRQGLCRRAGRARSGQAHGAVHPDERPGGAGPGDRPRGLAAARARLQHQAQGPRERLGQRFLGTAGLVPRGERRLAARGVVR